MDRTTAILAIQNLHECLDKGDVYCTSARDLIYYYMGDMGKQEHYKQMIQMLFATNKIMQAALIAAEFYERKFNIYKLWSAPNPLNNQGERQLLLIF